MSGRSKILPVDYNSQPTDNTCQSTCLKMMASYIEVPLTSVSRQTAGAKIRGTCYLISIDRS